MATVKVRYKPVNPAGFERKMLKSDFSKHDVDQEAVLFNQKNKFTAEMSQEAFDLLKEAGEPIEIIEDKKEAEEGGDADDTAADDAGGDTGSTADATAGDAAAKSTKPTTKGSRGTTSTT